MSVCTYVHFGSNYLTLFRKGPLEDIFSLINAIDIFQTHCQMLFNSSQLETQGICDLLMYVCGLPS